jgi:DAK2 domain fusion protein YloV
LLPEDLRRVVERYLGLLRRHRADLNRLNVYPVPDGDTGTNMTLTMEAVVSAMPDDGGMAGLAESVAHASLMGAQGNSGIILSQILRGFADILHDRPAMGPGDYAAALSRASESAYAAVGSPVEGTILTVVREAAAAASGSDGDLETMVRATFERGVEALADTPRLLPVLAEAGVVDAGGAGFLLLLASFVEVVEGAEAAIPPALLERHGSPDPAAPPPTATGPRYEVMFLLDAPAGAGDRLREAWRAIGESIVVVGGEGEWNCHIHTDRIGASIEAAVELGTPRRIEVTDLVVQSAAAAFHESFEPLPSYAAAPVGVVAVGSGDGIAALFREAGAQGLVRGGQTMNPSVGDLLEAVERAPAPAIVVLPNNRNVVAAAEQLDALTTKQVLVVPTHTVPQGLAAMLAYQPVGSAADTAAAMRAAAADCRSLEITRAVRAATTPIGRVAAGEWLGVVDGRVAAARPSAPEILLGVMGSLVTEDSEVVTVITGRDADPAVVEALTSWLAGAHPDVEVEVHHGGQPLYPYLIGVE